MSVSVALFTRDLRVHDNPMLAAAASADAVVPLFVLDDAIGGYAAPNRMRFLIESLADLDASLRERGAGLVIRAGDLADEVVAVVQEMGAEVVHVSGDATAYAARRQRHLVDALSEIGCRLEVHDGTHFVVPPGVVTPADGDHMAVFTPYHRRWAAQPWRAAAPTPRRLTMPRVRKGRVPPVGSVTGDTSPHLPAGGETAARERLTRWTSSRLDTYSDLHDAVADDATSRLSPYLHFGNISPLEIVTRAAEKGGAGAADFVRQVCWRDFHAQVLAARPESTHRDYRSRGDRWHHSDEEVEAWREGRTGYPFVDAGMRQLAREGWMHNRARLVTAHFLTKTLYVDWRVGAAHFLEWLVDGDVANNTMNWQWCAGTGTDSRFNRAYNITAQARRHDPTGAYVRRYVDELADVDDGYIHEPWLLPQDQFEELGYPPPIVDQDEAKERMKRVRSAR